MLESASSLSEKFLWARRVKPTCLHATAIHATRQPHQEDITASAGNLSASRYPVLIMIKNPPRQQRIIVACVYGYFRMVIVWGHKASVDPQNHSWAVCSPCFDWLAFALHWPCFAGSYSPNYWRHWRGWRNLPLHGIRGFSTWPALDGRTPNAVSCPVA